MDGLSSGELKAVNCSLAFSSIEGTFDIEVLFYFVYLPHTASKTNNLRCQQINFASASATSVLYTKVTCLNLIVVMCGSLQRNSEGHILFVSKEPVT